jgi:hypothetical protein
MIIWTIRYEVGHGDLLVMGDSGQRRWDMWCRKRTGRSGPGQHPVPTAGVR